MPTRLGLPVELQILILSELSVKDIKNVMQVSKNFNDLITDTKHSQALLSASRLRVEQYFNQKIDEHILMCALDSRDLPELVSAIAKIRGITWENDRPQLSAPAVALLLKIVVLHWVPCFGTYRRRKKCTCNERMLRVAEIVVETYFDHHGPDAQHKVDQKSFCSRVGLYFKEEEKRFEYARIKAWYAKIVNDPGGISGFPLVDTLELPKQLLQGDAYWVQVGDFFYDEDYMERDYLYGIMRDQDMGELFHLPIWRNNTLGYNTLGYLTLSVRTEWAAARIKRAKRRGEALDHESTEVDYGKSSESSSEVRALGNEQRLAWIRINRAKRAGEALDYESTEVESGNSSERPKGVRALDHEQRLAWIKAEMMEEMYIF